jgi:Uri superfamily endonuclease
MLWIMQNIEQDMKEAMSAHTTKKSDAGSSDTTKSSAFSFNADELVDSGQLGKILSMADSTTTENGA